MQPDRVLATRDDVAAAQSENDNLRKIRNRLMQWESKTDPLAALSVQQEEHLDVLTNLWRDSGPSVCEVSLDAMASN